MATIATGQRIGSGRAELGRRLEARFLGLNDLLCENRQRPSSGSGPVASIGHPREPHF